MDGHDVIDRMLDQEPLILFSFYTTGQVRTLQHVGKELFSLLDSTIAPASIDGESFNRAYGLFWLWVLGAYEVTRTMCQAKSCFSTELSARLTALKKRLSVLRMPFAKQEYQGERAPIKGEASVAGVDTIRKDLTFEIQGVVVSTRDLVRDFESVFASITRGDIFGSHSSAYGREAS